MIKIKRTIGIFFSALLFVPLLHFSVAQAVFVDITVKTGCSQEPTYNATLSLQDKEYDAYVKLARRGEHATVTGYLQAYEEDQENQGGCLEFDTVEVNGDKWTKVGTFTPPDTSKQTVIELASESLANMPNANRPTVLLLPKDSPVCVPDEECVVFVNGAKGVVQPPGTMLSQNSLHVLPVADPVNDKLKSVSYYANDNLVYKKNTLEPFDMRFASSSRQSLTRVALYESGQQIVFNEQTPDTFNDSLGNFIFRLSQESPLIFYFLIMPVTLFTLFGILFLIIRKIYEIHTARVHRGFAKERHLPPALSRFYFRYFTAGLYPYLQQKREQYANSKLLRYSRKLGILGAVVLLMVVSIISLDTYGFTLFTVDGQSMQKTYFTGNKMLVNKIPVTLAKINKLEYVPSRGEVVIVHAVFGNVTTYDEASEKTILIKRVLALPGERVKIKDGKFIVFNSDHPNGFEPDKEGSWKNTMVPDLPSDNLDIQLGTGEIFVSGDNRPGSIDSRFNGPLKTKEIIGVVTTKIWPQDSEQDLDEMSP